MSAPEKDTRALFLSGTVVLVAALGGYLWYQAPLKSARPANPGLERHEAALARRAEARLWQDPLAAVDAHRKSTNDKPNNADRQGWLTLADDIAVRLAPGQTAPTTAVLLVMMDGSPYVEGTEQRIRDRYAVGSALSAACYVPEDGTHVGYALSGNDPPIPLPFEWYTPRALRDCAPHAVSPTVHEQVLVVWLSDELFGDGAPLRVLSSLTSTLDRLVAERYRARAPTAANVPPVTYELIGPSGSALLRNMVEDARQAPGQLRWPGASPAHPNGWLGMYSPAATVSADVLAQSVLGPSTGATLDADTWLSETFRQAGIDLRDRIASDYDLSRALVHELAVRGVRGDDHIAILAEWDSFYGRTLSSDFVATACMTRDTAEAREACPTHGKALASLANPTAQRRIVPQIRQYTYLRGLDGELPGGESGPSPTPKAGGLLSRGADRSLDNLERPEGESQLDYVRRLADRLEADSEDRDFRAIGILGSDVYDKLLVLQALRRRFPHTLFFTTDLDARLIHPSQYDWTHNLIVASHYDLHVHPALQQAIPPFRSSYQAATFVAVLHAIGHLQPHRTDTGEVGFATPSDAGVILRPSTAPLVFEVGRTGVDLLPTSDQAKAAVGAQGGDANFLSLDPLNQPVSSATERAMRQDRQIRFALLGLGLLCLMYLAVPVLRSIPEEMLSVEMGQFIIQGAGALVAMLGAATALMQWLGTLPDGEPFYWTEGISIWPSEIIRLTVIALCAGFLRMAAHVLTDNATRLTAAYALNAPDTSERTQPPLPARLSWRWVQLLSPNAWAIDFSRNATSPSALWHEHEGYVQTTWRRIVPQALLLSLLGLIALYAFGRPHPPTRGTVSLVLHLLCWGTASLLTGLLMFYVVDAIRVCTGFIHQFSLEPTRWAPTVLQSLSEQRRLPADIVSEWIDIRFIAERTKAVGSLIHYPIIVLCLLMLARHRLFDDWSYPPGLLVIYGITALYIVISAVLLSAAAEKARKSAAGRLRNYLYLLRGQGVTPLVGAASAQGQDATAPMIAQVEMMLQDIQGIQDGAFAHWTQHPVFQALLVPSGGFSMLALLDYFLTQ